jgi:hypothetical protein
MITGLDKKYAVPNRAVCFKFIKKEMDYVPMVGDIIETNNQDFTKQHLE